MKRQQELSPGVYKWSTGQIGTSDLPQFVAECAYHKYADSKRRQFHLANIKPHVASGMHWRGQLARAYARIKQANKVH